MNVQLKQRLVGFTVLGFVFIIILPILFGHRPDNDNIKDKKKQVDEFVIASPEVDKKINKTLPREKVKDEELFSDNNQTEEPDNAVLSQSEEPEEQLPHSLPQAVEAPKPVIGPVASKKIENLEKIEDHILNNSEKLLPKLVTVKKPTKIPPPHLHKKSKPITESSQIEGSGWVIQLGSFTNKENANKLLKQLQTNGFVAFVKSGINSSGKEYSRVLVGPEIERNKADEVVQNIQKLLSLHGVVVRYKG